MLNKFAKFRLINKENNKVIEVLKNKKWRENKMVGEGSTYVELKGKFTFGINQSGLDFKDKKEREEAIDDFWDCFNKFLEGIATVEHNFLDLDYKKKNLKVSRGE